MVVIILAFLALGFLAVSVVLTYSQKIARSIACQAAAAGLLLAAFSMHGWTWLGAALCVVLFACLGVHSCALVARRRLKSRLMARYAVAEALRRPPGTPELGPRRWL